VALDFPRRAHARPATVAAMLSAGPLVLARRGCVEPYASHRVLLWPRQMEGIVEWALPTPTGLWCAGEGVPGGLSGTVVGHAGFTVAADLISVGDRCGIVHDPTRIEPFTERGEGVAALSPQAWRARTSAHAPVSLLRVRAKLPPITDR